MTRLAHILALAGTALLPMTNALACYTTEGADPAADAANVAANAEYRSGELVGRSIGTLASLSAEVTVYAPPTAEGRHAADFIQGMLGDIDRTFRRTGLTNDRPSSLSIQISNVPGPVGSGGGGPTEAWTWCEFNDCTMVIFAEVWPTDNYLNYVVAHEVAHAGQELVYPRVRDSRTGWWGEGTAEWFANLVVPGRDFSAYYVAAFDARSHDTGLTEMCYETVAFFMWAGQALGETFPFAMAAEGEAALMDARAVADMLPAGTWHDFVETFLGGDLTYPDGRPARPSPSLGPVQAVGDGQRIAVEGWSPLAIPRLVMALEPGEWQIDLSGTSPLTSFLEQETGTWFRINNTAGTASGFTHTVECTESEALVMTTIGMREGLSVVMADISGERDPCGEPCDRPVPRDHCMIGAWTALSTDLPDTYNQVAAAIGSRSEWTYQNMGDNYAILWPDGTFVMAVTDAQSEIEHDMGDGYTMHQRVIIVSDTIGRWSVVDDQHLIMCTDAYLGSMVNQITIGGVTETNGPLPVPYDPSYLDGDGFRFRYDCAGDTADISLLLFGTTPMVSWHVERRDLPAPPPEPF